MALATGVPNGLKAVMLGALLGAGACAVAAQAGRAQSHVRTSRATSCPGDFRWPVKTMTDPSARKPWASARPKVVTIHALVHRTDRPRRLRATTPRQLGAERTIFRARARLVAARVKGDGDIYLVIADPRTKETVVAEFPDTTCAPASHSSKRAQMTGARVSFIARCEFPPLNHFTALHGTATITGVGFYDKKGHQRGQASNGIELHPVLAFSGAGCT